MNGWGSSVSPFDKIPTIVNNLSGVDVFKDLPVKDKILLTFLGALAIAEDVFNKMPMPRDVVRGLYGTGEGPWQGVKKNTFEQALLRLLRRKYLEKEKRERVERYRISQEGWQYLYRKYPQIKLRQKTFDGFWRIVVYDIDEAERKLRDEMRSQLNGLGFRMVQKSVWASPYDWEAELTELFRKMKLREKALVFKTQLTPANTRQLLSTFWSDVGEEEATHAKTPFIRWLQSYSFPKVLKKFFTKKS